MAAQFGSLHLKIYAKEQKKLERKASMSFIRPSTEICT